MWTTSEYGDSCAEFYDCLYGPCRREVIEVLVSHANHGKILELGVGTGRTAIPLAQKGVDVTGIEISSQMLAALNQKPDNELITIIHGDFATANLQGKYELIYALCSTLHLLPSYSRQLTCFRNIARHLAPGGSFLVEASVPDAGNLVFSTHHQRVSQTLSMLTKDGVRAYRVKLFRTTPAQIDKMAESSGMHLKSRWANWHEAVFVPACSPSHVSIYTT